RLSAGQLDLGSSASQTQSMSHIYIRLDFGTDEEKAQLARHKLDGWKQAFRLDKKLLYKLDRPGGPAGEPAAKTVAAENPAPSPKVIQQFDPEFEKADQQFESLD